MQYVYSKHQISNPQLTCINSQNPKSIDVLTRDLVTSADIKLIEVALHAKFVRTVDGMHYLFRK